MVQPRHFTGAAAAVALGTAVLSTVLAVSENTVERRGDGAVSILYAASAWVAFLAAAAAWNLDRPWAPWTAGAAVVVAAILTLTTADTGVIALVAGHAGTVLLLMPMLWTHVRSTGWSFPADLRAHKLRWANVVVALVAALAANFSGALYAELEPRTEWGPWAYVGLAWATSMLAACAWMPAPWRRLGLVLGGLASACWFVAMLPFAFVLNLAGHFLATVFFLATAWSERPPRPAATKNMSSESSFRHS